MTQNLIHQSDRLPLKKKKLIKNLSLESHLLVRSSVIGIFGEIVKLHLMHLCRVLLKGKGEAPAMAMI